MTIRIPAKFIVDQDGSKISVFHANAGEGLSQHSHEYSHLTFCHAGKVVVRKEGRELMMTKDTQPVNLVAGEWHEIEAVEDGSVFVNIFNLSKIG